MSIESAYYYVLINSPAGSVVPVMEIREGGCNGDIMACTVGATHVSSVGWDSMFFNSGQTYVILIAANSAKVALPSNNLVVVGKTCPVSDSFTAYNSSPQIAYFYSSTTTAASPSCIGSFGRAQQMFSYTPGTTGYHYVHLNGAVTDGTRVVLEMYKGKCSTMGSDSVLFCEKGVVKVGINSVYLVAGQEYTLLLGVYVDRSDPLGEGSTLEVGLATIPSYTCTDNPALTTTGHQSAIVNSSYTYNTDFACDFPGSNTKEAQYVSFTPPTSDHYHVRVANTKSDIVVEIRTGSCNGVSIQCDDELGGGPTTGFNSIYLFTGTTYIILIAPYWIVGSLPSNVHVEIGLASNGGGGARFILPTMSPHWRTMALFSE